MPAAPVIFRPGAGAVGARPQAAGVGTDTGQPAPAVETGPLIVGLAVAAASIVAGALISVGRSGRIRGAAQLAVALLGSLLVGPWTGWFAMGAVVTVAAAVLALIIRRPRTVS